MCYRHWHNNTRLIQPLKQVVTPMVVVIRVAAIPEVVTQEAAVARLIPRRLRPAVLPLR